MQRCRDGQQLHLAAEALDALLRRQLLLLSLCRQAGVAPAAAAAAAALLARSPDITTGNASICSSSADCSSSTDRSGSADGSSTPDATMRAVPLSPHQTGCILTFVRHMTSRASSPGPNTLSMLSGAMPFVAKQPAAPSLAVLHLVRLSLERFSCSAPEPAAARLPAAAPAPAPTAAAASQPASNDGTDDGADSAFGAASRRWHAFNDGAHVKVAAAALRLLEALLSPHNPNQSQAAAEAAASGALAPVHACLSDRYAHPVLRGLAASILSRCAYAPGALDCHRPAALLRGWLLRGLEKEVSAARLVG